MSVSGFKRVTGASNYRKWTEWKVGDYMVGKYNSQTTDKYNKPNYSFEVQETKFADGKNITTGDFMTLNSNGSLDFAMKNVEEGDIVMVVYKGKDVQTKGPYKGKEFHKLEVLVKDGAVTSNATPSESDDEIL